MDEQLLNLIYIIVILVVLAVFIYVIVLIKRIEYNTRTEARVFIKDVFLRYIILNNTDGAKKYVDNAFASEFLSAKHLYFDFKDKEAFERVINKYKEIYSSYNIPTPEDFDNYSNIEYIEKKLNLN